ncbi:MAG TPA: murein L,D-transpeptidase family protein [Devosiaceae bacterium]
MFARLARLGVLLLLIGAVAACNDLGFDQRAQVPLSGSVKARLSGMQSSPGAPMLVRIFKEESQLEVWKQTSAGTYKLFNSYKICAWSGDLGPKIKEGDRQSPEGFYSISRGLMNPKSNYYLAFNTGFPNKFDRAYGRTGSNLMVHGDCSSRGCYAMTDEEIAEIYALARESLAGGNNSFSLEIYPFRMTPENIARHQSNPNMDFWRNLKTGYDIFEITRKPATWDVCDRKYVFDAATPDGKPLDATAPCPNLSYDSSLVAALNAKQAADDSAVKVALADEAAAKQKAAEAAAAKAQAEAEAKARGEAISNTWSGFWGGLFGGGGQSEGGSGSNG